MKYLNLGCGLRFHPDWTNIDSDSSSPYVQDYDLQKGIPFQDNFFDVVYHSHLLEHFPKHKATDFMIECFRVLKPGGTIRIVVPDLEQIAKLYLKTLMLALKGKKGKCCPSCSNCRGSGCYGYRYTSGIRCNKWCRIHGPEQL